MKFTNAIPILALPALTTALHLPFSLPFSLCHSHRLASPQDDALNSDFPAETTIAELLHSKAPIAQTYANTNGQRRGAGWIRLPEQQDIDAELAAEELATQNELQTQATEEEFAQEMDDAAWKTASVVASDQIQIRQFAGAASAQQQRQDAVLAALQTREAQIEAEEAALLRLLTRKSFCRMRPSGRIEARSRWETRGGTSAERRRMALAREQQLEAEEAAARSNSQTPYRQASSRALEGL